MVRPKAGTVTLKIKPSKAGRARLRARRKLKVKPRVTYRPSSAKSVVTLTQKVTLRKEVMEGDGQSSRPLPRRPEAARYCGGVAPPVHGSVTMPSGDGTPLDEGGRRAHGHHPGGRAGRCIISRYRA